MFQPQQTSYTNFYPQVPQTSNPNQDFNGNILFPPQILPSELPSEPQFHPPGTDPYAPATSNPPIPFGFEAQIPHYEDPNAVSQSWVVKQADPVSYTTAINSSNEESVVSTNLNSLWSNYWMNQVVVNGVANTIPKQTKVTQPMWCDICNLACNSKDVFVKHISGKKHKRKLKTHNNSSTTSLGASRVADGEILETKGQKLMVGGATVDSTRFCIICNVACNSQVVFDKHLVGKKHAAAQADIRPPNGVANPNSIVSISPTVQPQGNCTFEGGPKQTKVVQFAWCEVCKIYCNSNDILVKHELGKKHQKKLQGLEKSKRDTGAPASTEAPVTTNPIIGAMENPETGRGKSSVEPQGNCTLVGPKQIKAAQSAWCEVCKIYCNNNDMLILHQFGKKHQKKMKLDKSEKNTSTPVSTEAPVTTNPIVGPMENPETHKHISTDLKKRKASRSQASDEDLETKKRKIMEGGAAAGDVRTCTVCNVVCNSPAVYNSHLAGHKHAAMLKKQVEAGLTSAAPQVVATT